MNIKNVFAAVIVAAVSSYAANSWRSFLGGPLDIFLDGDDGP
jgi:hypothetical protein